MPIYNFKCKSCNKGYEQLLSFDKTGKYKGVECPHCGSKKKNKLLSACNFMFAEPEGTDRWNSESGGHDYRFKYKLPSVIAERQKAEEKSHMGSGDEIYRPMNDLERNDSWGEVK